MLSEYHEDRVSASLDTVGHSVIDQPITVLHRRAILLYDIPTNPIIGRPLANSFSSPGLENQTGSEVGAIGGKLVLFLILIHHPYPLETRQT